jgi:WD40 repeat protein
MTTVQFRPSRFGALATSSFLVLLLVGLGHAAAPPAPPGDDPLPRHARLRLGTTRFRALSEIEAVALSPDGKSLAVFAGNRLVLYETATGKTRRVVASFRNFSPSVVTFRDGGRKLIAAGDRGVRVWDTASWRVMDEWVKVGFTAHPIAFSADGNRFAVGHYGDSKAKPVIVRDLAGKKEVARFPVLRNNYVQVALSPDGKRLAAVGQHSPQPGETETERLEQCVQVWDVRTLKAKLHFETGASVLKASYSPDGKLLALSVFGEKPGVQVRDAVSGKLRWQKTLSWC